ncbi:MAG: ROK family protein [Bacteroidota bacterium]
MNTNTYEDKRMIMTLDAGGTNFVFSAIRSNTEIIEPISKRAFPEDLQKTLDMMIAGFEEVKKNLKGDPEAISFAFPGPADYPEGIIGNLPNFKAFTGDVPLGPMLEDHFKIPVYINNDGNLFAYGEALAGYLPELNKRLKESGSLKQYNSLIGFTLGTGFGAGIVLDKKMLVGNSSSGAEIHNTLNPWDPGWNAEESVSTRAIQRVYAEEAGIPVDKNLMPRDIYAIANGTSDGFVEAARTSFQQFGKSLGNSVANAISLIDALVVLGGGITAAWDLFAPAMFEEINRTYTDYEGNVFPRLSYKVYNLEDPSEFRKFAEGSINAVRVPGSGRTIKYDNLPRNGIGLSKLGASQAIALGAYAFALQQLDS